MSKFSGWIAVKQFDNRNVDNILSKKFKPHFPHILDEYIYEAVWYIHCVYAVYNRFRSLLNGPSSSSPLPCRLRCRSGFFALAIWQFGNLAKASLCQSGRIKKITVEDWAISGGLKRLDNLISGDSCWQYGHCDRLGNSLRGCSWPSQRSSQGGIWKCDDCKIWPSVREKGSLQLFLWSGGCACCKWRGLQSLLWSSRVRDNVEDRCKRSHPNMWKKCSISLI